MCWLSVCQFNCYYTGEGTLRVREGLKKTGHTKTRITDQQITEHGSRFRYRITCHNYYSMVIIFHSAWEPVSKSHFKMAGVCKWAISVTEAYFMDDTRLVGNRMIE